MTGALIPHPHAAEAAQRIRAREQAEHAEKMHNLAVEMAKRIIDKPTGVSDAKLGATCTWYMRLSKGQGGGGDHYLRADAHLTGIRLREAEAREAQETSVKVALRYRPHMLRIALGFAAALIVAAGFHFWVMP